MLAFRHACCVPRSIDVAVLPAEADHADADCYVVVDLLRATTTIAALFANGLATLTAVASLDDARARARETGALLAGEVGGLPPPDFDLGNSPVAAAAADLRGRDAVLFTTNGTRALCAVAGRGEVLTGALANLTAVARACATYRRVVVVCAGEDAGRRVALEDVAAAGAIVRALVGVSAGASLGDGAHLALLAAGDVAATVAAARHTAETARLGLGHDTQFALRRDTSDAVPRVIDYGPGWTRLADARPAP
jgi:2-phosphosulfolactate phosphatase